jgi:hypothetical protein
VDRSPVCTCILWLGLQWRFVLASFLLESYGCSFFLQRLESTRRLLFAVNCHGHALCILVAARADVGESFIVLFRVATLSGWSDVTRAAMAVRGADEAPRTCAYYNI